MIAHCNILPAREAHASRHNGGLIEDILKPLNVIMLCDIRGTSGGPSIQPSWCRGTLVSLLRLIVVVFHIAIIFPHETTLLNSPRNPCELRPFQIYTSKMIASCPCQNIFAKVATHEDINNWLEWVIGDTNICLWRKKYQWYLSRWMVRTCYSKNDQ